MYVIFIHGVFLYKRCLRVFSRSYVWCRKARTLLPVFVSSGATSLGSSSYIGATAYALATAYTLVTAHVGIRIRRSEITATVTEGINAALDTDAFAMRMAMVAQTAILETQKASLSAQYTPASEQGNPSP